MVSYDKYAHVHCMMMSLMGPTFPLNVPLCFWIEKHLCPMSVVRIMDKPKLTTSTTWGKELRPSEILSHTTENFTLQETNISHLGKRKNHLQICLITGDMLVQEGTFWNPKSWRLDSNEFFFSNRWCCQINHLNFPGLVNFRSPCFTYNICCWICKITPQNYQIIQWWSERETGWWQARISWGVQIFIICWWLKIISYCWWLKSCTTWDVSSPVNNGNRSINCIMSYHIISYHVKSYHIISYPIISNHHIIMLLIISYPLII